MSSGVSFAQYALSLGGSLDLVAPDGSPQVGHDMRMTMRIAGELTKENRVNAQGELLRVEFGVLNELSPNGSAERLGSLHYCALTYGHYLNCLGLSVHLLRHTAWMPDIGTPTSDIIDSDIHLAPGRILLSRIRTAAPAMLEPWSSDCPYRMRAAFLMRQAMMSFVLCHEYYHAALGHCDILKSLGLTGLLGEVGMDVSLLDDPHLYRWFEYLADQAAVRTMIETVYGGDRLDLPAGGDEQDLSLGTRIVIVAAGLLATIWHCYTISAAREDVVHPAPKQRLLLIMRVIQIELGRRGRGDAYIKLIINQALEDLATLSHKNEGLWSALNEAGNSRGPFADNDGVAKLEERVKRLSREFAYNDVVTDNAGLPA